MNKKIIIANWKMQLDYQQSLALAKKIRTKIAVDNCEVVLCPDFTALTGVNQILKGGSIKLGAQDCFWQERGAYTGEVAPQNLKKIGCQLVILGHSERRKYCHEDDKIVRNKLAAVLAVKNLTPVVCIGEMEKKNTAARNLLLKKQVQNIFSDLKINNRIIIAYEPSWAICTGEVIGAKDLAVAVENIVQEIARVTGNAAKYFSIIYGGSIATENVASIIKVPGVSGLLVGGASLDVNKFYKIIKQVC